MTAILHICQNGSESGPDVEGEERTIEETWSKLSLAQIYQWRIDLTKMRWNPQKSFKERKHHPDNPNQRQWYIIFFPPFTTSDIVATSESINHRTERDEILE